MVQKTLATNKPCEYSVAKKAEIKEIIYNDKINTIPIIAAILFTFFI
jgi:hypothetical protein